MTKIKIAFSIVLVATLAAAVRAQESAGQNPTSTKGAVIKGKAPVNKHVLQVKLPAAQEATLKNGLHVVLPRRAPARIRPAPKAPLSKAKHRSTNMCCR